MFVTGFKLRNGGEKLIEGEVHAAFGASCQKPEPQSHVHVNVAKLGQRDNPFFEVVSAGSRITEVRDTRHEVFCTWHLLLDINRVGLRLLAHAHTATHHIVDVLNSQGKFGDFVGLFNSLTADYDLSTIFLAFVGQLSREDLSFSSHYSAHSCLNLADFIIAITTITVNNHKSELLLLLEIVWQREASLKIRIQIVFNLLGLTHFDPTSVLSLEYKAPGV